MENFNEISDAFLNIMTRRELARVLGIPYKNLIYYIYKIPEENKYTIFDIQKRNGGVRQICAPIRRIKDLQRKICIELTSLQKKKKCVHGYMKDKSIKSNAQVHIKKRIVINLDLKDFFQSINFGRVRGLFKNTPFNFNDEIATTLAQICCYKGHLPQGSPSSPILSNFICYRLDCQILNLVRKCKVDYTRYADDLTFSTNLSKLPKEIGTIVDNIFTPSRELEEIINSNGFILNREKMHFSLRNNRQKVTGLVVNRGVNVDRKYVRHVRAIIHAWEKYGIEKAANEHFEKYNYKNKTENDLFSFVKEIQGKIGYIRFIKGENNSVYRNIYKRIKNLDSEINLPTPQQIPLGETTPIVFCEGKTDGYHLEAALKYFKSIGEFLNLNLIFYKYDENMNMTNSRLWNACTTRPDLKKNKRVEIYLFDRDVRSYNDKVAQNPKLYKYWNNKVYSALLPVPSHREFDEICIEHFYTDKDLTIMDDNHRRIYLSNEFISETGFHKKEDLTYQNRIYLKAPYPRIIDSKVCKENGKNVALSKTDFARNIFNKKGNFKNVSFESFRSIFSLLEEIIYIGKNS